MILIYNNLMIVCVCKNINSKKSSGAWCRLDLEEIKCNLEWVAMWNVLKQLKNLLKKLKTSPLKHCVRLINKFASPLILALGHKLIPQSRKGFSYKIGEPAAKKDAIKKSRPSRRKNFSEREFK